MQLWPPHIRAFGLYIGIAVFTLVTFTWLALPSLRTPPTFPNVDLSSSDDLLRNTQNATLGFEKMLVINFPDRTDRSDKMSLMAAVTGLHFDYVPAFLGDDVKDVQMPPDAAGWVGQVRGSWRGHVNALRAVVEQNLTSAVIMEDDLDWDIRIKEQMYDYALTTRALTQPLAGSSSTFADPTFPQVQDTSMNPDWMDIRSLPKTELPKLTPYGDNWDLLWLGHCGMRRPLVNEPDGPWHDLSLNLPKGIVTHRKDDTVPKKEHLHWWVDHIYNAYKNDFPPHTRITHHPMDAVCNFAYAVTQQGARKILYELGVRMMNDAFDLMLRDWCQWKRGHEELGGVCVTVQPGLFSHFIRSQPVEGQEGDPGWEKTKNIRWSVWANLPKLLRGETDYVDQWPD